MTAYQPQIDGRTFLENLQNITYKTAATTTNQNQFLTAIFSMINHAGGTFESFFNSFNASNPLPATFDHFLEAYYVHANIPFSQPFSDPQFIGNAFFDSFRHSLNSDYDWAPIQGFTEADTASQFKSWFAAVIAHYVYPAGNGNVDSGHFFTQLHDNLRVTAGIRTTTAFTEEHWTYPGYVDPDAPPNSQSFPAPLVAGQEHFPRFETIFKQFFPTATEAQFSAVLTQFYNQILSTTGYFVPSYTLEAWTDHVIQLATGNSSSPLEDTTSLASIGAKKTHILNDIYVLIATLLNSIQRIAAVQSSRLNLLTQWQQAYAQSLSTLHSFLSTDNSPLGGDIGDTTKASFRASLNDVVNSNYRSQLQNNQSIIGDDSKSLQGNINQAQDEISQQNNRATAIIQELSSLLNAIFK